MAKPTIHTNAFYTLLRSEKVQEFNRLLAAGNVPVDALRGGDFRGLDLRELETHGLDLRDGYFRGTDVRGVDFSGANLNGASFGQAHISGCLFPPEIHADDLRLSVDLGTRVRYYSR